MIDALVVRLYTLYAYEYVGSPSSFVEPLGSFVGGSPLLYLVEQEFILDWAIVLSFEHKLRKEAMRLVMHEGFTLANALRAVTKDADLKEAFFTTPVALRAASSGQPQNKWPRYNNKGSSFGSFGKSGGQGSKGKGKSGKSKGKDTRLAGLQLAWRTPDGRDLCFAYNSGSCDNSCNRVHQCRVKGCYGDHPAIQHREKAKGSN